MRVIGNTYSSKPVRGMSYDDWKNYYIEQFKPNVMKTVWTGIYKDKLININLSGILNTGAGYSLFGESVKRILMKSAYIGKDPFKELKGFIDKNIVYYEKDEEFMRELAL